MHHGKLRAWSRAGGPAPPGIANLGDEVWTADAPDENNGVVILGTPLGRDASVESHGRDRLEKEALLLDNIPKLDDVQCAWLLLSYSTVPRANHMLRMLPPQRSNS